MLHVFFHFSLWRLVENVSGGAGLAPSLPSGTFSWFVFYSFALFSPDVVLPLPLPGTKYYLDK
jgi:hypothetical protein